MEKTRYIEIRTDKKKTIHYINPIDAEFTICSLAFDSGDNEETGLKGLELIKEGKVNCKECSHHLKLWKAFIKQELKEAT